MNFIKRLTQTGLIYLWIPVVVIAIDRLSKDWAFLHLMSGEPFTILPFLNFILAYNTGAAFSFLHAAGGWQNGLLGLIAIATGVVIITWLYRIKRTEHWVSIALCLILGGALGNVWDRWVYGFVIDFFDFHWGDWHFAIFNVADSAITIGACMLIWHWIKNR